MKLMLRAASWVVCVLFTWTVGQANSAMPQPGLWIVDSEATGKPGRGFQVDLQSRTLVFTYYGYKPSGAPTFFLASGAITDAGVFESQLFEYQGGRTFGGGQQDAVVAGSAGLVTLRFVSSTSGLVTFPGEAEKSMSRFTFADTSVNLRSRAFSGETYGVGPFASDSTTFTFNVSNNAFNLTRDSFFSGKCIYTGGYTLAGAAILSSGTYKCSDFSDGSYRAEALQVDENGLYSGVFYRKKGGVGTEIKEVHAGR